MAKIIGISGQAGSGKDTAANYLCSRYGYVSISLADPMKRLAREIYQFTDVQLWGDSEERNRPDTRYVKPDGSFLAPREVLQRMGTELGRACYLNTWVDMALRDANKVLAGGWEYTKSQGIYAANEFSWLTFRNSGVVIPDCRFKNEIDAIHAAGGRVIRLRRRLENDPLNIGVANHASELEQQSIPDADFDLVIDVPEGKEAFYAVLGGLLKETL